MTNDKPMTNKICVITGATSGIGRETAQTIAGQGGHVVIIGRNKNKCVATVKSIQEKTGNNHVDYLCADLSDLQQVEQLANDLKEKYPHIDVLLNNAGAYFTSRKESVDGYEMSLALNYLSPFLLTTLLLDPLKKSEQGRIINVSSTAQFQGNINFEDLHSEKNYDGFKVYAQSKLALMLFSYELADRLKDTSITVNTVHPGLVASNFGKNNGLLRFYLRRLIKRNELTPHEGSKTLTYLATSDAVANTTGGYFVDNQQKKSAEASYDKALAAKLWTAGEAMIADKL